MSKDAGESGSTASTDTASSHTMVRLPIHKIRRPSVVPASDLSPVHPHPSGSPPPTFSSVDENGRAEKDLGAGSVAVTRAAEEVTPAPAYSPPRSRSATAAGHARASASHTRPTQIRAEDMEMMGWAEMKQMVIDDYHAIKLFAKHVKWKELWPKIVAKAMFKWYAIVAIAVTLTVLVTTQHDKVVHWCAPVTRRIREWPAGWMIPIVLLIIVSYPPLVGHEIIGILIGLVWGLGEGFAILAAGTFIGEILLWFSFKWCCHTAASKFEKKNKLYWSLTQLIREKTFMFVLILRFSAIPGHIVTAVSASAGANYWSYLAAAFLTLPKQFTIVYLGSAFGHKEKKHVIISTVTMITTIVVTGVAAIYIYYQMRMVMKRRDRELANSLPVHQGDMAMVETCPRASGVSPAWAAVPTDAGVEDKNLEVYVPDLARDELKGLGARRPWLFSNPSFSASLNGNANGSGASSTRTWSVPHHMTETELREFRLEMEQSGVNMPMISVDTDEAPPAFGSPFTEKSTPAIPARDRSPLADQYPPRDWELLGPPASRDPSSTRVSSSSDRPTSPRIAPRSGGSLDLARPASSAAMGGREIADDADMYAYERGGRRPDYSRMRGESRAALLGRPTDDQLSIRSGKSAKSQGSS